jgi:hypothetical protein
MTSFNRNILLRQSNRPGNTETLHAKHGMVTHDNGTNSLSDLHHRIANQQTQYRRQAEQSGFDSLQKRRILSSSQINPA